MGGEPTFVSIDDYESAEWNTAALGPDQARARRRSDPPAARSLRAGRPAALRPGQVVSRRAAAALGVRAATGARDGEPIWREPGADRRRDAPATARRRRRAARSRRRSPRGSASSPSDVQPAFEDPAEYMLQGGRAAGQRRSERSEARRSARSATASCRASSSAGSAACRLRAAGAARGTRKPARGWSQRDLEAARGDALFLMPGDSPVGFRLPLRLAALCTRPTSRLSAIRSRRCEPLPDAPSRMAVRPQRPAGPSVLRSPADGAARAHRAVEPAPSRAIARSHRPALRAARRPAVRLHAADSSGSRTISSCSPRSKTRPPSCDAGAYRRLPAAGRSAPQRHQGDARSRRDRGQRAAGGNLARGGRHHARSTTRRACAARHREVHARRPAHRHRRRQPHRGRWADAPTARSCAGRTCSRA